ncbi:MAG: flagellar basal body-associated FliL family protein [Desulfobacterales bacterium]|uniref:Flagellar protein FliL n=1 Tax=Candidatus Desulfatibia profunda TaxID=2841695 RepID=A0A8J6NUN0_9BACT|nr:flagellar basal body-associated FliL family protein [Candidatus Desulfatibia profunda]MBL7181244.1 flagellar basal body-associated FliL family protein [Desulfobacterales bacterium]MBL7208378.1 flagellar basal body-associated FliL family protein [Desulfobacterales bacterium]
MNLKQQSFIIISVIGLLVLGAGILNHFKKEIKLPEISLQKTKKEDDGYSRYVKCSIVSNIGPQNILKMEMAIPYENKEQCMDLKRNMNRIKNDFIVRIEQQDMEAWVTQKDFAAIKSEYIKIINQNISKPVQNLYFKSLNIF